MDAPYKSKRDNRMAFNRRSQPKAMTLLEVVVSVSIILLALIPLLQLQVNSLRMKRVAYQLSQATALAQTQLAELKLQDNLKNGHYQGRLESPDDEMVYAWFAEVQDCPDTEVSWLKELMLKSICLKLTWEDGKTNREVSMETVVRLRKVEVSEVSDGATFR